MIEYLRLALATGVVLLPGRLVARALGQRSVSATLAWATACVFVAWTAVFALHSTVRLALAILAAIAVGAAAVAWRGGRFRARRPPRDLAFVLAGGVVLGILLWHVAGIVSGDGLFHLARVRKLVELGDLHLRSVDEFKDGGLHPGYAYPLWHAFLALVAKVSGLDSGVVVNHETSLLAPLACAVAWEAGAAVFDSAAAGFAVLAGQLGLYCFAAGHGGAYAQLALPGSAARQLFVPASIALFFGFVRERTWPCAAALAACFGALALVHPTYALFLLVPLGAYAVVRLAEWRVSAVALAASFAPTLLALLWLKPIVDETVSHDPRPAEQARALRHYADQLDVFSPHSYRLAPEVVGRGGAVAVAALVCVPLAGLAVRRRWAAFVLGGTVSVLALMLVPTLFTHFSDAVSLSQSRRAAGFLPFTFALAGGLALLMRSAVLLPAALVAGIVLQRVWPGDFEYGLKAGGPALVTWIAFAGGAAALGAGLVLRHRGLRERHSLAAVAAALFVAPVAVHGLASWSPRTTHDANALPPSLVRKLRNEVPARSVVIAPLETSYRILAAAPVYVVAAPPAHVADTTKNRPYERRRALLHWLSTHDPAVPRRYGATWEVRGGKLRRLR